MGGASVHENTANPIGQLAALDKTVFEPRRFAILSALRKAGDMGYVVLREISGLSQGNLATHLRKLEDAGLVEIRKRFVRRRPNSRVFMTAAGREAYDGCVRRYLDLLKEVEEEWQPPSDDHEGPRSEAEERAAGSVA